MFIEGTKSVLNIQQVVQYLFFTKEVSIVKQALKPVRRQSNMKNYHFYSLPNEKILFLVENNHKLITKKVAETSDFPFHVSIQLFHYYFLTSFNCLYKLIICIERLYSLLTHIKVS